jgi:YegS/Rv2252/BmrU family lipid kinase
LAFEAYPTAKPGEATTIARQAAESGVPYVVAVGGDGTVHEVVRGLLGSQAVLGVLPTGSGNDFCKAVGIPLDLAQAINVLTQRSTRRVDVATFGEHVMANGLGIGLDGAVSHRYRRMKRLRGELGYLWGAIYEALRFRAFPVEIHAPGEHYTGPVLFCGVSNGPYHGGDFQLAPEAKPDDGRLDVHIVRDMAPLRRLAEIPKVRRGKHLDLPEFTLFQAPWVEITVEARAPAHVDGEPFWLEPGRHRIEILPNALEVIAPCRHSAGA